MGAGPTGHTSATRYLCAAAHLDEAYARDVFDEVLHQPFRAVAPSYAVDLGPIVRHCLAARQRLLMRDALITGTFVVSLVLQFTATITAGFLVLVALVGTLLLRATRGRATGRSTAAAKSALIVAVLIVLGLIVLYEVMKTLAGLLFFSLAPGLYTGQLLPVGGILVLLVALWAIATGERLLAHHMLVNRLSPGRFDPRDAPPEPWSQRNRLAYVQDAQWGNVTVYAGALNREPFVGSGHVRDAWSVPVPLTRSTSQNGTPPAEEPLTPEVLYDAMRRALLGLASGDGVRGERLPGLSVEDRLFVSGLLPPGHWALDANGLPRTLVSPEEMRRLMTLPRGPVRHYQSVRVNSWDGEVAVTVFLHFGIEAGMLYVEFVATVLPPIKARYHAVDAYRRLTLEAVTDTAGTALLDLPMTIVKAPANLVTTAVSAMRRRGRVRQEAHAIDSHLAYDYGSTTSARELGAEPEGSREIYFQMLDANRHIAVVQRRAIAVVEEVLRRHGYSTGEYEQRVNMVINQGMVINGGTFNGNAFAAGDGARAKAAQANAATPPATQSKG